jgi:DNA-directed RNA polymerase sigma subunit (sigma70/sigma32)
MAADSILASIPDPAPPALDVIIARDERVIFARAFDRLASTEPVKALVLARRYGLGGHEPHTLEQIATEWGAARGDIRKIETRAISALVNLAQSVKL